MSTFIAKILLTVSIKVSPLLTEEAAAEKFTTSAESRFSAKSKESFVRVEFSKNKLAMVISLSEGTFFIGRLITSLKLSAVSKIKLISANVSCLIPSKCLLDNSPITLLLFLLKLLVFFLLLLPIVLPLVHFLPNLLQCQCNLAQLANAYYIFYLQAPIAQLKLDDHKPSLHLIPTEWSVRDRK